MHHQDAVAHGVALPGVGVVSLGEQGGDTHHLCSRLASPHFVLPPRQLGAEDDGGDHEDCGQESQGGDDDEAVLHDAEGGAGLRFGDGWRFGGHCW